MDVDALMAQLDIAADVLLSLGMRVRDVSVTPTDVPPGLAVVLTVTPPVRPLAYTVEAWYLPTPRTCLRNCRNVSRCGWRSVMPGCGLRTVPGAGVANEKLLAEERRPKSRFHLHPTCIWFRLDPHPALMPGSPACHATPSPT